MNELVSVVIPTHNRSDLLPRAINSVLNQTYSYFEIIVVSDGSTDNTEEVVKSYSAKDSRIRFIGYSPARGGNIARNTGIEAAKGEYVAFLDDDDEWMPEKLKKQVELLKHNASVGLVYTGVHIIYVNEKVEYNSLPNAQGNLSRRILLDNIVGTTSTVLVKKEYLTRSNGFDNSLKALQDYELWIRLLQRTNVGCVKEPLINYYNYTGSKQVSALTVRYEESFRYILEKHSPLFSNLTEDEEKVRKSSEVYLLFNKSMRNRENKKARMYAKQFFKQGFVIKGILTYMISFTNFKFMLTLRRLK